MSKYNDIERRSLTAAPTIEGDGRKVVGYAAVFEQDSEVLADFIEGAFVERIERGAFDGVVEVSDVLALLNHDTSRGLLARSRGGAGTLTLSIDDKGLRYEFEAPNTAIGDEVLEGIRRGDINGSSFAFEVAEDSWSYEGEVSKRTITKIAKIYDVSPVYYPAYQGTEVSVRSLTKATGIKAKPKEEFKERIRSAKYFKYRYL